MTRTIVDDDRSPDLPEMRAWAERVATYFGQQGGWPAIAGRAVGWLMVCDPPEQSAADIAEAIQASRGSLTSTLRLLRTAGLVRPITRAGGRTIYYRLDDDAWAAALQQRFAGLTAFLHITRDGLEMLGERSPRATRVRAAHDLYSWLADEVEPLWKRWDQEKTRDRTHWSEE